MTRLSIPDMSCGHCRASIETALGQLAGVEKITFNQDERTAEITGTAPTEALIKTLDQIGFHASTL